MPLSIASSNPFLDDAVISVVLAILILIALLSTVGNGTPAARLPLLSWRGDGFLQVFQT
jgi:hypothetical protein